MKLRAEQGNESPRLLDEAEPGQAIADVLPDDLRYGPPAEDQKLKITSCCKTRFKRPGLFDQHQQRWLEEGVCLGSIHEDAHRRTVGGDQQATTPADEDLPPSAEQLLDEVGWWR